MNRVGRKGYKISFHVVGLLWDFRYLQNKEDVSRVRIFCPPPYPLLRLHVFVKEKISVKKEGKSERMSGQRCQILSP
jgi:hypothetical protein